jgi:hypothetical protein
MSQAWRAAAPVQAADLADGAALAATERLEHASQVLEAALVAAQARGGERLPAIQTAGMSKAEQKQLPDAVRQTILAEL